MPRKNTLPASELEILARLQSSRRALEMPRRLFAKAAGLDSSTIVRLELGRMPLRYGVARALCSTHSIDPEWLATGEGSPQTAFGLPFANQVKADENALFSDVFKNILSPARWEKQNETADIRYGRGLVAEFWSEVIDSAFEKAPLGNVVALDHEIRNILQNLVGPVPDHPQIRNFLKHLAGKKHLTHPTTSAKTEFVQDQWHRLKARINKATDKPGSKSALAKFLGVDLTQLSKWLTDSKMAREPGADYTLKMLHWVQERESQ